LNCSESCLGIRRQEDRCSAKFRSRLIFPGADALRAGHSVRDTVLVACHCGSTCTDRKRPRPKIVDEAKEGESCTEPRNPWSVHSVSQAEPSSKGPVSLHQ